MPWNLTIGQGLVNSGVTQAQACCDNPPVVTRRANALSRAGETPLFVSRF